MLSMERRRQRRYLITVFKYLKGYEREEDLLPVVPEGRIRTSVLKLQGSTFRLDMRKNFLTARAFRH